MRESKLLLIFILTNMLSWGCERSMTKSELVNYVRNPENGLIKTLERNEFSIQLAFRPKDLIIQQEVLDPTDESEWSSVSKSFDSLDYFVLKLSMNGREIESQVAQDPVRFSQVVNYLTGGIGSSIYLKLENRKINVESVTYVQSFGSSNGSSILLVFKSFLNERSDNFSVIVDDQMLGIGRCEFDFSIGDIKSVPALRHN